MLTRDQAIIDFSAGRAVPDRLTRKAHAHYVEHARRMLAVYRSGLGLMRRQLHYSIQGLLGGEADCPMRRVEAFCKLLDDASTFDIDKRGKAAALRLRVFEQSARFHPLVEQPQGVFEHDHADIKRRIAADIGQPWDEIEAQLYSDMIDQQRLLSFEGYADAAALLSRYNVAQLQASLYGARRLTIHAGEDFKTIIRYAKLARLLHEIYRVDESTYRIDLSGPASVLLETRRYGVNLARFVPALLACRGWKMHAAIRTPWGTSAAIELSSKDGLVSHLPPPEEFDSSIEKGFAAKWGDEPREGWRLSRETVILHDAQSTFIPDFVFRHESGREALMEIVGFWTPEYLESKRKTIERFRSAKILLAIAERCLKPGANLPQSAIIYKTVLKLEPVLEKLRQALEA